MADVMWSLGQLAERDGVSKQAVQKHVAKLVEQGVLPVERDGRGRILRVSVAHYDHHRGLFGQSTKAPVRETPSDEPDSESYDEARRQQAWLDLGRKKLDHAREIGQVVRSDRLAEALVIVGRTIQSEIGRLQNRADDIALAVSKEGTSGARLLLRKIGTELSERIADALAEVASTAPAEDEVIDELEE